MDITTARLILTVDSTVSPDDLRLRFNEHRERLEARIVAAGAAEKEEHRQALARLQEAYALLSGAPAAMPVAVAPAAPRSGVAAAMVAVLLVLGLAAGGGWWWFQQRSAHTRDRLLAEIATVNEVTEAAANAALEAQVQAFAGSGTQADHIRVAAAWNERCTTLRIARERRMAELSRRLEVVAEQLKRLAGEVDGARTRIPPLADLPSGPRRSYAETRLRLWGDYLGWLGQASDNHPARTHAAAAKAALGSADLTRAEQGLSAAEQSLTGWSKQRQDELDRRFNIPLLNHCAELCATGNRAIADWYKADESPEAALRRLAGRLTVLDRTELPPATTAGELALYTALGGDARLAAAWRDKLRRITELSARMAPLDDPQATAGAWLMLDKPLAELTSLVGERGAPVAGWVTAQRERHARLEAARRALVRLDGDQAKLTIEQAEALDLQLEELAELVAADDADLARWQALLDPLAAASRFQRAMALKDPEQHKRLLVAAARGGSLDAGSRMVVLAMWNEMGTLDPRSPQIVAWATADSTHGPFTARQIYGEFLANWATRHKDDGIDWNAEMHRGRELMVSGPLAHPVLLNEVGWLYEDITPDNDPQRAKELRLASANAAEAAAASTDPLAAESILVTGADGAQEADDNALALRLYERAADVATRDGRPLDGAWKWLLASGMADDPMTKARLVARALAIYRQEARAAQERGDLKHHALSLRGVAACLRPDYDPANATWEMAAAAYAETAAAFAAAKLLREEAGAIELEGDCWSPDYNPGGSWEKAAACYGRAGERAKAGGASLMAAQSFAACASCHSPAKNSAGSWTVMADLYGQAAELAGAAGSRSFQARYLRDQARGLLEGSSDGTAGQLGKAAELYASAAALMAASGNRSGQAHCLHQQAWCLDPDNNPNGSAKRCIAVYQQAIEVGLSAGRSDAELAVSYFNLGLNLMPREDSVIQGSWAEASEALANAARHYEAGGRTGDAGQALYQQALCLYPGRAPSGGYAQTLALANEALARLDHPEWRASLAGVQSLRGDCLQPTNNANGSWAEAAAAYSESARLYGDLGNQLQVACQLRDQAWCLMPTRNSAGSWSEAEALYAQAAQLASRPEDQALNAHCLHQQAVCAVRNDPANLTDTSRALFRRAANLYRAAGREADAKISEDWIGQ